MEEIELKQPMTLSDYRIVGAMVPPTGAAAFDRGRLVLAPRDGEGEHLRVRRYVEEGVEGVYFDEEDWQGLQATGHGIALPEAHAESGLALWVFRPHFVLRNAAIAELRAAAALRGEPVPLEEGTLGCLVHEPSAEGRRARWAERAHEEALALARAGLWEEAQVAASRAFVWLRGPRSAPHRLHRRGGRYAARPASAARAARVSGRRPRGDRVRAAERVPLACELAQHEEPSVCEHATHAVPAPRARGRASSPCPPWPRGRPPR